MRKIYITLLIAILCGGCTSRRPADGEPLYVSILPLRSLLFRLESLLDLLE